MYADDTPEDDAASALNDDLISQALHNDALRPRIERAVIDEFVAKRQRRFRGYAPTSEEDWGEWLKERVLLPEDELPEERPFPYAPCRQVSVRRLETASGKTPRVSSNPELDGITTVVQKD